MKPVILESPYAGNVEENLAYGRKALRDCLLRGEAPFASHLIYTAEGVLDDSVAEERALGIGAGYSWGALAKYVVVYTDRGISGGMQKAIKLYSTLGLPILYRKLEDEDGSTDY